MNDLEKARKALVATLKNQGRGPEYIGDFMSHFDDNLKNVDDWKRASEILEAWQTARSNRPVDESVELRADEHGKPCFHLSPSALAWLLDYLPE